MMKKKTSFLVLLNKIIMSLVDFSFSCCLFYNTHVLRYLLVFYNYITIHRIEINHKIYIHAEMGDFFKCSRRIVYLDSTLVDGHLCVRIGASNLDLRDWKF